MRHSSEKLTLRKMKLIVAILFGATSSAAFQWRCQHVPENERSSDENGKPFCQITNVTAEHLNLDAGREESTRINLLLDHIWIAPKDLWNEKYFSFVDYLAICNSNFLDIPVMPELLTLAIISSNFTQLSIRNGRSYRLEALKLWETSMESFPSSMNQLAELKSIEGESNSLKEINLSSFSGLKNLRLIALKQGQLSSVVLNTLDLPNLTRLDLSVNSLTEIPNGLANLAALEELHLWGNKISSVEMTKFKGMTKLKKLDLSNNRLTQISTGSILHLPALEEISLQNCELKHLDVLLWEMPALKLLDVQLNDLLHEVDNFASRFRQNVELRISTD